MVSVHEVGRHAEHPHSASMVGYGQDHPHSASMVGYGLHGSPARSSRSTRHHSRKKPSLFEKLCFGQSAHADHDDYHDNERHATRGVAVHGDDRNSTHAVHGDDWDSTHSVYHSGAHSQYAPPTLHAGPHTSEVHPPWSGAYPSMQTHYEPVAMPPQIGLLSTFQQSPSMNMWQRPSSVSSVLRAPSLPQLPSLAAIHGQSAPSRPASRLGSPVGSVSIPVATPPPLGAVPHLGSWPQELIAAGGLETNRDGHDVLQAGPHALAASFEHRKQMFEQSLRHQFEVENRRIQEITIAQKEVVRQRALEQKANIDRQAAAAMCNLDRRGAEQVVGLQRNAHSHRSQLEIHAQQFETAQQLHFGRTGVDMRTHAVPGTMQFSRLPPPPMAGNPPQVVPIASAGFDTNHDGRPHVVVTGLDMNRDGIPDVLQVDHRHVPAPTSHYWQAVAHAGGYQPHSHMLPPGYAAAPFTHAAEGHMTPRSRSPVVVEFPSHLGAPPSGSPINTSVLGSSV